MLECESRDHNGPDGRGQDEDDEEPAGVVDDEADALLHVGPDPAIPLSSSSTAPCLGLRGGCRLGAFADDRGDETAGVSQIAVLGADVGDASFGIRIFELS
jgi:hypothetical protein